METAAKDQPNIQTPSDEIAIRVSGLSKRYLIGGEKKGTLTETLAGMIGAKNNRKEEFWALQDINFEVKKGEVIGIIGKNGAGKSTLLKILSRITQPTSGKIEINGRVASLLEVGTGFHPELTGRENIYLNGTILGMSRQEVKDKFEEIVEFSGVRKFIDTPVKHYSSGMYVRLAFAVAAHLEPEILIIDEVLAVGDAEFQKKCLGKMKEVAGEGRTVLFVSHNMTAVRSLCDEAFLLINGKLVKFGNTNFVINEYLGFDSADGLKCKSKLGIKIGDIVLKELSIINEKGKEIFSRDEDLFVRLKMTISTKSIFYINYRLKDDHGNIFLVTAADEHLMNKITLGESLVSMTIPKFLLNQGKFTIDLMLTDGRQKILLEEDVLHFEVLEERKNVGKWMGKSQGPLRPVFNWYLNNES